MISFRVASGLSLLIALVVVSGAAPCAGAIQSNEQAKTPGHLQNEIAVLFNERFFETGVMEPLADANLRLIEPSLIRQVRQEQPSLIQAAYQQPKPSVYDQLAPLFEAHILVVGTVSTETSPNDYGFISATANVEVRVVSLADARILATRTFSATDAAGSQQAARSQAYELVLEGSDTRLGLTDWLLDTLKSQPALPDPVKPSPRSKSSTTSASDSEQDQDTGDSDAASSSDDNESSEGSTDADGSTNSSSESEETSSNDDGSSASEDTSSASNSKQDQETKGSDSSSSSDDNATSTDTENGNSQASKEEQNGDTGSSKNSSDTGTTSSSHNEPTAAEQTKESPDENGAVASTSDSQPPAGPPSPQETNGGVDSNIFAMYTGTIVLIAVVTILVIGVIAVMALRRPQSVSTVYKRGDTVEIQRQGQSTSSVSDEKRCPNCGQWFPSTYNYCTQCEGQKLS